MIKLVATDIDGTILGESGEFTPGVKNCIKTMQENGLKVVIVTGRMFAAAKQIAKRLNLTTPVVAYQGGMIKKSAESDEVLYDACIPVDDVKQIIRWARENNIHLNLYSNDILYVEEDNPTIQQYASRQNLDYKIEPFDDIELSHVNKLLAIDYTDAEKVHIEALIALAKAEILEAGDTQEVEAIKNQCIEDVEAYIEGLSKAIGDAEAYLNSLDATLTSVKQLIYQYKQQISSASTVEEVASLLVTFEKAYFEALVDAIKTELNAYIENLDYNAKEKTHIKTQQDALYTQIATLDNIEEVEALVEAFKVATQNAHTELIQKRDEAINKVETASKKTDEALTYCTQILSDLNLAGTKEEVAMLMEDFDTTLATLNQKTNNCTCSNSAYIYIFVTIIFTTSLILLRKKH